MSRGGQRGGERRALTVVERQHAGHGLVTAYGVFGARGLVSLDDVAQPLLHVGDRAGICLTLAMLLVASVEDLGQCYRHLARHRYNLDVHCGSKLLAKLFHQLVIVNLQMLRDDRAVQGCNATMRPVTHQINELVALGARSFEIVMLKNIWLILKIKARQEERTRAERERQRQLEEEQELELVLQMSRRARSTPAQRPGFARRARGSP